MISNFTFYNPTRIVFGSGSIAKLNKLVPKKLRLCFYMAVARL